MLCAVSRAIPPPPVSDYKIHCLYLYKFSQSLKWPTEPKEFIIGVVGISPLIPTLEKYIESKNKSSVIKYKVVRFANAQAITECQILYVVKDQINNFDLINAKVVGKSILVVSEVPGLIKRGSGVNFIADDGYSIKVQMNKAVIESHQLKTTTDFLKLGTEIF
jgi:hypothetical protein